MRLKEIIFLGLFILMICIVGLAIIWYIRQDNSLNCSQNDYTKFNFDDIAVDSKNYSHMDSNNFIKRTFEQDVIRVGNICYVDSQIILTAKKNTTFEEIAEMAGESDASIVGYLSVSCDFQIEFNSPKTYEELTRIIKEWSLYENIEMVSLNYVCEIESDSIDYEKDPWIDAAEDGGDVSGFEWDEQNPCGSNWWAEAIRMPSVWNMDIEYNPVKVGIYDTYFDVSNEDLDSKFINVFGTQKDYITWIEEECKEITGMSLEDSIKYYLENMIKGHLIEEDKEFWDFIDASTHGTHVAGIIGAEAENGFGIAGVSQNSELYGYASLRSDFGSVDIFEWKYGFAVLLNNGAKVINCSMAFEKNMEGVENGDEASIVFLNNASKMLELFFLSYIDQGYDFLIVKAAGNLGNDTDAKNDVMGAIDNEEVRNRILIVGAIENTKNGYKYATFTTTGDRVDIYAPGVSILSDVPGNITQCKDGTSMAAPIVTGVVSLIWGIAPELSAVQVVEIIKMSTDVTIYQSTSTKAIPIVDAYYCVLFAQQVKTEGNENNLDINKGVIMGEVLWNDEAGKTCFLNNVAVNVYNEKNNITASTKTSVYGSYDIWVPAGNYVIEFVDPDGEFKTVKYNINVKSKDVIWQEIWMTTESGDSEIYIEFLEEMYNNLGNYINNIDWKYIEENKFAIEDIDQDGIDELIVKFTSTDISSMYMGVWKIDGENDSVYQYAKIGVDSTFYSNGIVKVNFLHNHTCGMEIWPYSLLKYDESISNYVTLAYGESCEEIYDWTGETYSPEKDVDDDGIIYFFYANGEDAVPLTLFEYEKKVDEYISETKLIEIEWIYLTEENINNLSS